MKTVRWGWVVCTLILAACGDGRSTGGEQEASAPASGALADHGGGRNAGEGNRLVFESSPYLHQHAYNPVDWYPWGEEAFAKARREDKPIFLSIGYSTCHWCHVMERESFEDEDVAAVMNEHFVSIKVDREERPDVDAIYMAAIQQTGQRGGWPLSAFLTPDLDPFFLGTYFPPEDRFGRPGFRSLLRRIAESWATRRADLVNDSRRLMEAVGRQDAGVPRAELGVATLAKSVDELLSRFDAVHGGFGIAPKFPAAFNLSHLMAQSRRPTGARAMTAVHKTLDAMRRGGIHDHLGGGFHRYSTDREWLVPHFEKMLYDQAYLARAYLDAYVLTRRPEYSATVRSVLEYVLRDLRDDAGGFYSAEDADSEGEEGKFYVWTRGELLEALGADDGALFADVYGCTDSGNFLDEASGARNARNILHLRRSLAQHARDRRTAPAEFAARIAVMRAKLFAIRSKRIRPHVDDKVLTDWNGMIISAFARAGAALDEPRYILAATEAADFILRSLRPAGRLLHRYRAGTAGIAAFLDDYAFLGLALIDLYEATLEPRWLEQAAALSREMIKEFRVDGGARFHLAPPGRTEAGTPPSALYDGATPSGNSAAIVLLVRLGRMLADEALSSAGRAALEDWSGTIARHPSAHSFALSALDELVGPAHEIVIAGSPDDPTVVAFLASIRSRFLPNAAVLLHPPGPAGSPIRRLAPFVQGQVLARGRPAAYVCHNYACLEPVTSVAELERLLDQ